MDQTRQITACSFIPPATNNYTARVYTWRNRVLQRALERLELLDAKVSRAVLRGRGAGNSILLPDSDVQDAEWLADLLQHGLLQSSYVPPVEQQDLRDLTRLRSTLVQDRARLVNRILKTLETAGIKLRPVLSDVMGVSGRSILRALAAGERDPQRLAGLVHPSLQRKHDQLVAALQGGLQPHHGFLLRELLSDIEALEHSITHVELEISARLRPFEETLDRLEHITGVGQHTLEILFAEVGWNMDPFPDAAHLASWAGMCPGQHESAGKRLSGRVRKGNKWLRAALVQAAHAAARTQTYLGEQYRRLSKREGANAQRLRWDTVFW